MNAEEVIKSLALRPHPEGGHYRETFRDDAREGARATSTAIYYLLKRGERSRWHRVDAVEIWHYHAGAPLVLSIADDAGQRDILLGVALGRNEVPQGVVPKGAWQAAATTGEWTLVGCTVAPGFQFSGFELAPRDFRPGAV